SRAVPGHTQAVRYVFHDDSPLRLLAFNFPAPLQGHQLPSGIGLELPLLRVHRAGYHLSNTFDPCHGSSTLESRTGPILIRATELPSDQKSHVLEKQKDSVCPANGPRRGVGRLWDISVRKRTQTSISIQPTAVIPTGAPQRPCSQRESPARSGGTP